MPTKRRPRPTARTLQNNGYATRITPYLVALHLRELEKADAEAAKPKPERVVAYPPGTEVVWHADADYDSVVVEARPRQNGYVEYFIRTDTGAHAWAHERDLEAI